MSKHKRTPKDGPSINGGSQGARQTASLVLEVMSGLLRPSEAANALGINLPRYYIMEKRALEGMIGACEPREKGPGHNPEKEVECLKAAIRKLENEVLRYQALARAAQRTIGLSANRLTPAKESGKGGRKRRKPQVRALKVCKTLRAERKNGEPHAATA